MWSCTNKALLPDAIRRIRLEIFNDHATWLEKVIVRRTFSDGAPRHDTINYCEGMDVKALVACRRNRVEAKKGRRAPLGVLLHSLQLAIIKTKETHNAKYGDHNCNAMDDNKAIVDWRLEAWYPRWKEYRDRVGPELVLAIARDLSQFNM